MDRISVLDLYKLNNPIIIDIRNAYYYDMGHMKGAISIPYYNLLNNFGYHVLSVDGGYLEYQRIFGK